MFSIRRKIILIIVAVTIPALLLCELAVRGYLKSVLIEQIIAGEELKMIQMSGNIDRYCDSIVSLGIAFAIEAPTQSFFARYGEGDEMQNFRRVSGLMSSLMERALVFDCLGAVIAMPDGQVYYRTGLATDTQYFAQKVQEDWFVQDAQAMYFSKPFRMLYNKVEIDAIAFVMPIYELNSHRIVSSYCIFLFPYQNIADLVSPELRDSMDGFCWMNSKGDTLLRSGTLAEGPLPTADALPVDEQVRVAPIQDGWLILKNCESSDWILVTHISERRIRAAIDGPILITSLFIFLAVLIIVTISMPVLHRVTRPIGQLSRAMREVVASKNMQVDIQVHTRDELRELADCFREMMAELDRHTRDAVAFERKKADIEFELLLSQVNPHFIYNCLNSIMLTIKMGRYTQAVETADALIRLLQNSIRISEGNTFSTVKDEIEIVNFYLTIQQIRYRDSFSLEWRVEEGLQNLQVPKLIIHPLVENAILHGILPGGRFGHITVDIRRRDQTLILQVTDDGIGIEGTLLDQINSGGLTSRAKQNTSIGVKNIRQRIAFLFGGEYGLNLESRSGCTVATVRLPVIP